MRLPARPNAPVTFTLTDARSWHAFARSQLAVGVPALEIAQWQPYDGASLGQRARGWVRFAHTGELGGLPAQVAAGVSCLGGAVLVWTGFALATRRLLAATRQRSRGTVYHADGAGRQTMTSVPNFKNVSDASG
jgi:uncharacterized iron-regulated membrane protein